MEIRVALAEDDDQVANLFAAYAKAHGYELGDQDVVAEGRRARDQYGEGLLVATDPAVLGCVAYEPWGDGRCRMKRMFVSPEARGRGVGRGLAVALMEAAAAAGFDEMVLDTSQPMEAARRLYAALGFQVFDADYEAPCREVVYMRRSLLDYALTS